MHYRSRLYIIKFAYELVREENVNNLFIVNGR